MKTEITVHDFVMLLVAEEIRNYRRNHCGASVKKAYRSFLMPIARIYLNDGTNFSCQVHCGVHAAFEGITPVNMYSPTFGTKIVFAETDIDDDENIEPYMHTDIKDIEAYAEKHGGIDFATTTQKAIESAIKSDDL